jgi:hypothetical protein
MFETMVVLWCYGVVVVLCCGGVVLVGWCSWPDKSTHSDVFILALVPWWLDTSVHAYGE